MKTTIQPDKFPGLWANYVNKGLIEEVVELYNPKSVLMPTFSPHCLRSKEELRGYFTQLASREALNVRLHENTIDCLEINEQSFVINGIYSFEFQVDGTLLTFPSRFTFVIDLKKDNPILHHHSSQIPRNLT